MNNLHIKKICLYLLICSIALSALMGIWAILSGEFGEIQEKILLTTLTVVGTSILGLACGSYLESPHSATFPALKMVPSIGIVFALLAAISSIVLIWASDSSNDEGILKTFFIALLFAFSLAQLSLLSLARLAARFQWALIAAYIVILLLDGIISTLIIAEFNTSGDFLLRLIGVLSVIAAALTVMIPVFHRLSRADFVGTEISTAKIGDEIAALKIRIAHLEKQREDIISMEETVS